MSITEDIKRIVIRPRRGTGRLPDAPARDAIPAGKASAYPTPEESSGGGIASPVTENKVDDGQGGYEVSRTYIQEDDGQGGTQDKIFLLQSSDGLYTFEYKLLAQIDMTDDNGNPVSFIYQEVNPDTGEPV